MFAEVPKPIIGRIFIELRYFCMLCIHGGVAGVIISIFNFEAPGGPLATLPVSSTVKCVVALTSQCFFVYFVLTVMLTVSEMSGDATPVEKRSWFSAVESARSTMTFAPILAILFVTTRLHALTLTDKMGAPPRWVQDGMYLATVSLLISSWICLGSGMPQAKKDSRHYKLSKWYIATGLSKTNEETDCDGPVANKFSKWNFGIAFARCISMLLVYSGMVIVMVGLFTMIPEGANGRASMSGMHGHIVISTAHTLTKLGSS